MKYLLLLILFTAGCSQENCPDKNFRDYSYNSDVKVIFGFYKGQTGKIIRRNWIYTGNCNIPGFKVRLDSTKEIVTVSQFDLYVE